MDLDHPGSSVLNPWRGFPAMYPLTTNSGCDMADLASSENQSLLPPTLPSDPKKWCHPQVCTWLEWCVQQFSLPPIDLENFHMNGKALCLLTKSDFKDRVPRVGDVLYNTLHILLHKSVPNVTPNVSNILLGQAAAAVNNRGNTLNRYWPRSVSGDLHSIGYVLQDNGCNMSNASPSPQSVGAGSGGDVDSTVILSPAPSIEGQLAEGAKERSQLSSENQNVTQSDEEEDNNANTQKELLPIGPGRVKNLLNVNNINNNHANNEVPQEKSVRLLWDFLQQLLNDAGQKYKSCIAWKEKSKGIFKIVDPHKLACLWGLQKNHLNMNFDKMSRALRYYYRVKILQKEPGERHCYRFLRHPSELRNCKQRSLLGKLNNSPIINNNNNNNNNSRMNNNSKISVNETDGALDMSIKDEWTADGETF